MTKGVIIKGIGGFYTVRTDDGELCEVRARGRFRIDGITPLPGDRVELRDDLLDEILPRKNVLPRPPVANVDQLCIVISAAKPAPDLVLTDKLLLYARMNGIDAVIVINKMDAPRAKSPAAQYARAQVRIVEISAKTGGGMEELKTILYGKCTCLAGQSAVGKSSIMNALAPELCLATGGMAKKTDRGRHTTRHTELIELSGLNATVIDTPGFSMLACMELEPELLGSWYPEFTGKCRFDSCVHDKEPDCAVKAAVESGSISKERYERYLLILKELKERRERQYD